MPPEKSKLDALKIERTPVTRREGTSPLVWLVMLVLVVGGGWYFWQNRKPPTPEVRTTSARPLVDAPQRTVLNASGYVTARRRATVSAKTTGKVIEVLIEEGQRVEKDEVVARLDDVNIRAELELYEAQFKSAEASLAETEAQLKEARRALARSTRLLEEKIGTQAQKDADEAQVETLEARLVNLGEEVKVARTRIAVVQRNLDDTIIRAPFSGVVVSKDAQPGEMISPVSAGGGFTRTGIGTIVDMNSLEIEVDVNESYINRVQAGQEVEAYLEAYQDWTIAARVIAIVPTADRQKATVRVRIGFEQLDPRILPDMGVKVAFRETEQEEPAQAAEAVAGVLIPARAVYKDGERDVVYLVMGGKLERRAVTLGPARGTDALVTAGLQAGQRVMVDGPQNPLDGMLVKEM